MPINKIAVLVCVGKFWHLVSVSFCNINTFDFIHEYIPNSDAFEDYVMKFTL